MIEYRELGRTGIKVSAIGIGTWQWGSRAWGYGKLYGERDLKGAFDEAIELGINFFDTAEIYAGGLSEKLLGKFLEERRSEVILATKLWPTKFTYSGVRKALERSLSRLRTDYLDLYQVHWPNPFIPTGRIMKFLERLWLEGLIRAIGVSNFNLRQLEKASTSLSHTDIASNQVKYNLIERVSEELLSYCRKERISLIAYSPLAQGLLSGKYGVNKLPVDKLRRSLNPLFEKENLERTKPLLRTLKQISDKLGRSVAQIALNWLIRDEFTIAIVGVKNQDQVGDIAGAMGWRLSEEELRRIEEDYEPIEIGRLKKAVKLLKTIRYVNR